MPEIHENTKYRKEFKIVTSEDKPFVLIHKQEKEYYLEETIIKDNSIVIDTTKQKIISGDEITYEIRTFKSVKRKTID